jgi:hypothetical protein
MAPHCPPHCPPHFPPHFPPHCPPFNCIPPVKSFARLYGTLTWNLGTHQSSGAALAVASSQEAGGGGGGGGGGGDQSSRRTCTSHGGTRDLPKEILTTYFADPAWAPSQRDLVESHVDRVLPSVLPELKQDAARLRQKIADAASADLASKVDSMGSYVLSFHVYLLAMDNIRHRLDNVKIALNPLADARSGRRVAEARLLGSGTMPVLWELMLVSHAAGGAPGPERRATNALAAVPVSELRRVWDDVVRERVGHMLRQYTAEAEKNNDVTDLLFPRDKIREAGDALAKAISTNHRANETLRPMMNAISGVQVPNALGTDDVGTTRPKSWWSSLWPF